MKTNVLITNFTEECKHLKKGAAVEFLEETQDTSQVIAVADFERARADVSKLPHPLIDLIEGFNTPTQRGRWEAPYRRAPH